MARHQPVHGASLLTLLQMRPTLLFLSCFLVCYFARAADTPPNIVMIVSDDHLWSDYGFMGHPHIKTPNLDKLAGESLTFRRGYVPSSLCCPSLASIITGLYPHQHRITSNDPPIPAGMKPGAFQASPLFEEGREVMSKHLESAGTLPQRLAAKGYLSLQTGKWWQKSYERMIQTMLRDGVDLETIAKASMPSEIREADYIVGKEVLGGWLDLQETLQGFLYQGESAINPLQRLEGIEQKGLEMLKSDPDECLFVLFQALADPQLGYCATHALLSAAVCDLTAEKLDLSASARSTLFRAALTMNIGMARAQDSLTRQSSALNDAQRKLIREHPQLSVEILQKLGVDCKILITRAMPHRSRYGMTNS